MATPKTPRKRVTKSDSEGKAPPDVQAETNAQPDDEIADAEVIIDTPVAEDGGQPVVEDAPEVPTSTVEAADVAIEAPAPPVGDAEVAPEEPVQAEETPVADQPVIASEDPAVADAAAPEPETQTPDQKRLHLEPTKEVEKPAVAKSGSVFVPMLLGGVVAAGIGFGLARFVVPEGWPIAQSTDAVTALETTLQVKMAENASDIADMKARLEALAEAGSEDTLSGDLALLGDTAANALETANNAQHAVDGLLPRLDAAETTLTAMAAKLAALETRPTGDPSVDAAVIDQLSASVDSMRAEVEAQKAAAEAAAARLAQEVELARSAAEAKAQTTLLQAAAAQVQAALQSGVPFDAPLAQLGAAGVALPAPLPDLAAEGAPTVSALRDSFGDAARAALDVTRRGNVGQSVTDRISSFMQTQTSARSLTPREGDDADAVLSRAEAALRNADLPGALALVAALPAPAQDAMAGWVAQANTLLAAQDAAKTLSAALSER